MTDATAVPLLPPIRARASSPRASSAPRSSSTTSTRTRRRRCSSSRSCSSRPATTRPSLLASFAVFGAAMVARPIGAVVFGHFGDRFGRKATLVASLLTMGIATFLIGCLPTYQLIGWWAALLLLVLRLAQGFALGGEWSGAALVATENAPAGKRAWYGTFPQLGAPLGFIIANAVFLAINFAPPPPRRHRPALRGVPRVGLARAVPVLGRHGDHRPVGAAAAGRVGDVRQGRGEGRDPQVPARRRCSASTGAT